MYRYVDIFKVVRYFATTLSTNFRHVPILMKLDRNKLQCVTFLVKCLIFVKSKPKWDNSATWRLCVISLKYDVNGLLQHRTMSYLYQLYVKSYLIVCFIEWCRFKRKSNLRTYCHLRDFDLDVVIL